MRISLRLLSANWLQPWVKSVLIGLLCAIVRILYFVHTFFRASQTIPIARRKHFVPIPLRQEILIGRSAFNEWMVHRGLLTRTPNMILPHDHPDSIWARNVAERLIRKAIQDYSETGFTRHFHNLNWNVVLVDADVVNVHSFPGGLIVLYTGLLNMCRSEDDLATIMAHEVSHLLARHGMERHTMVRWALSFMSFLPADIFKDIMALWLRPWLRRVELEADLMGFMLMASAGYNPRSAPGFFDFLQFFDQQPGEADNFWTFTLHPPSAERGRRLRNFSVMLKAIQVYHSYCSSLVIHWE